MSAIANSNQPEDKPKTSRVQTYWRNIPWKKLTSLVMAIALCFYLTACGGDNKPVVKAPVKKVETVTTNIVEVSPPTEIQRLSRLLDGYEPQVSIVSPKPDEVINSDQVAVKFDVKNLPIFKNADFSLGPHIHVTLDNQEYKALYDLSQTTTFDNLSPGTHTIRAFASRPWHESFKNKGAYAQVSFNVLTKTGENTPDTKIPLLTYSRPVGTYGAEPVMLDFYLQNAPLHLLGKDEPTIDDWQVRATVNGQSFTFDRWEPIYLKGLKSGKNWVKLELLEDDGDAIPNVFNSTAHVINFQPNGTDTLSRLVRGEKIANIEAIVDPNYVTPTPTPTSTPTAVPVTPAPVVTPAKVEATPQSASPVPTATSQSTVKTEEVKPADKSAPTSVEPVVPVVKTVTTTVTPTVAPTKTTPIAPVKFSPEPTRVLPLTTSAKVTPILGKTTPVVKTTLEPVKFKTIPLVTSTPTVETAKVKPIVKVNTIPTQAKEPVSQPVTQEPISTETKSQSDSKSDAVSEDVTKSTSNRLKNYLKNFNFRRTNSSEQTVTKSEVKSTESTKANTDVQPEAKSTDNAPVVTDLSTSSTTPVKVLTKSVK